MLILAEEDGIVDMTINSIARRTNIPIEIIRDVIPRLEGPDPCSRTPDHDGRRIVRLYEHRDWGWRIVNFVKYRESASREMVRMCETDRKRKYRERFGKIPSPTPPTLKENKNKSEIETSPGLVRDSPGHVRDMSGTSPDTAR